MLLIYLLKKKAKFFFQRIIFFPFQADDKGRYDRILAAYCLFSFAVIAAIASKVCAAITYHRS